MGLGKGTVVGLLVILGLWGVSFGAVYNVGDSAGWTTLGSFNYTKWAANKTFHVGDTLLFVYHKEYHNVEKVGEQNFLSCNVTSPIATYATGNDSIVLTMPGHFYFLCGIADHCLKGQKFSILVTGASATAPTPSPESPAPPSPILESSNLWVALLGLVLILTGFGC